MSINLINSFFSPLGLNSLLNSSFFVAENITDFETKRPDLNALLTFNSTIFGEPTGNPPNATPAEPEPPTPAATGLNNFDKRDPFHDQVKDHYRAVLGRDPEQAGFDHWVKARKDGSVSDVQLTKNFFNSAEFKGLNLSDEEKITRVYRSVLGREPDAGGLKSWTDQLKGGKPIDQIIDGFYNSPERKGQVADFFKVMADNNGKLPVDNQPGILSKNPGTATNPGATDAASTPATTAALNAQSTNPLAFIFPGIPAAPTFGGLSDFLNLQGLTNPNDVAQQQANSSGFINQLSGSQFTAFDPLKILGLI